MERSNKLLLGAISGVACGWLTYKYFLAQNPRQKRNQTRRRVGVISQIFIHPFKSGRGILVDSAQGSTDRSVGGPVGPRRSTIKNFPWSASGSVRGS